MGCYFLIQGIFPTQQSNPGLLHSRQILYLLNYLRQKTPKVLYCKIKNVSCILMCLFVMYYLCEKYYKPITVQYYIADYASWVPRLTLLDLQIGIMNTLWNLFICRGLTVLFNLFSLRCLFITQVDTLNSRARSNLGWYGPERIHRIKEDLPLKSELNSNGYWRKSLHFLQRKQN